MANAHIRVSASGVVVRDGKILLVKFDDDSGKHYNLPGGGVDPGETAEDCCVREMLEETNALVSVGRLLLVRDYEPERCRYEFGKRPKLNLVFACELMPGSEPSMPNMPDAYQIGIEWVPLDALPSVEMVSASIGRQILDALAGGTGPAYVTERC